MFAAVFFGEGVRAGRSAGCLFDGPDFSNEEGEAGEGGGGFAGGWEGAGVLGAEGGGADEGLIDLVIFVVHGWCSVWIVTAEWIFRRLRSFYQMERREGKGVFGWEGWFCEWEGRFFVSNCIMVCCAGPE